MILFNKFSSYKNHKNQNKILQTMSFTIFQDFSMFYQIFLSSQVKQWVIIIQKHRIYELPHEMRNNLRLRVLGNKQTSENCLKCIEW